MKKQYSRRDLFRKFITKNTEDIDPLFEKYKRKDYNGRHYEPANKKDTTARVGTITSGIDAYTGTWSTQQAIQLLRRTQFGYTKVNVDAITAMGMDTAVSSLLTISSPAPSPPVNYYQNLQADENSLAYGADWTQDVFTTTAIGQNTNIYRINALTFWNLGLGLNQDLNIREKMTWFWYHFIPIDFASVRASQHSYCNNNSARISYDYIQNFRTNALGNFRSLIRNIATQPAMMYYLSNQDNTNTAPDENFAREVMELFTLGKDPLSQYTQDDVVAAAKVLTGWKVNNLNAYPTSASYINSRHDTSTKTFSSFFNNATIANQGSTEIDAFFDMIFTQTQVVSEYICRRLYRYFVYYDIDANIEANVITPLAQFFVASNWEIAPVLDKLFKSQHFYDMANVGVYIKSPFDLVIGSLRQFNLSTNITDATNYQAQYNLWGTITNNYLQTTNQVMGSVPNVSGWSPFYQNPNFHEYWINSNTIQKRSLFIDTIFNGFTFSNNSYSAILQVDVIAWVQQFPDATISDPDALVQACIDYLLPIDLSDTVKATLKTQNLLSNQTTNGYWTTAWQNYTSNPTNATYLSTVKTRLKGLLQTITQLAEYQLM